MVRKVQRVLTSEAFGRFLGWLSANYDLSVRQYETIRRKFIRYFIHKGCDDPDALFDQPVDIVVSKIETCAVCPHPLAYCYGVAKNVWRETMRTPGAVPLVQDIASSGNPTNDLEGLQLTCLERCLSQLSSADRDVVTRYHEGEGRVKLEIRKQLADELGGINAVRIRVCRIRKDLGLALASVLRNQRIESGVRGR